MACFKRLIKKVPIKRERDIKMIPDISNLAVLLFILLHTSKEVVIFLNL